MTTLGTGLALATALASVPPTEDEPVAETPQKGTITWEDDIPLQLSVSYRSKYFHGGISKNVGVEIDDPNIPRGAASLVREYDLTEGWVKLKGAPTEKRYPNRMHVFWHEQPSRQVRRQLRRGL